MCREIDCGFEEKDAFVYSLDDRGKLEKELAALEKLGFHAGFTDKLPLPFPVAGAVRFERQAQFDPLRFAAAAARGLRAYEHTPVRRLEGTSAVTDRGTIRAEKVIVATHFPFLNRHGSYFLKMYQHRSYVLALENAANVGGMYVDEAAEGLSFRNAQGMLLLGGGSHRTGKQGGGWRELEAFAKRHYPRAHIRYRWAAQDCMTLDGVPYIGPYSARTEKPVCGHGLQQMGNDLRDGGGHAAHGYGAGQKAGRRSGVFPLRSMLRPQLALNALEAAASLLTPTAPRCPHMGCALKWNAQEHSWDCPLPRLTLHAGGRPHRKIPRCGTLSWKGERRGFGERGFRSRPGRGNDRPRGFAAGEMRPNGSKSRGGNGSRVWERGVPAFAGDDYGICRWRYFL